MSALQLNSGTRKELRSSIASQLPLSPMRIFAIGVEHPLDAVVQGAQHPDASVKQWTSAFRGHDQRFYSGLPVKKLLLSLR
jgi:hypothetical protein